MMGGPGQMGGPSNIMGGPAPPNETMVLNRALVSGGGESSPPSNPLIRGGSVLKYRTYIPL